MRRLLDVSLLSQQVREEQVRVGQVLQELQLLLLVQLVLLSLLWILEPFEALNGEDEVFLSVLEILHSLIRQCKVVV